MKDVGIDVTQISRFADAHDSLINRILSPKEKELYEKEVNKAAFLASRFASKEAYFKATQDKTNFNEISVLNDANGKPYIEGHDELALSISDESGLSVAIVIVKE